MERKLATIRKIDKSTQLSDTTSLATLGGWQVVTQAGQFKAGDLAVYFEVDSWIPHALAPFPSKGKEPKVYLGVKGERLKTIRIRGSLFQWLLLPCAILQFGAEGDDVTEVLGIQKWE